MWFYPYEHRGNWAARHWAFALSRYETLSIFLFSSAVPPGLHGWVLGQGRRCGAAVQDFGEALLLSCSPRSIS